MKEENPVVLLTNEVWHIVEHSRRSQTALCGQHIQERRAHARLKHVGLDKICAKCRRLWHA